MEARLECKMCNFKSPVSHKDFFCVCENKTDDGEMMLQTRQFGSRQGRKEGYKNLNCEYVCIHLTKIMYILI